MKKEYTNEELIRGLMNDSRMAFCYLYDKYYESLNRFAFHIVMCEESHDIVNDLFMKLWLDRKKLNNEILLKSYLFTSVKNSALNYLKHRNIIDKSQSKVAESILFLNGESSDETDIYLLLENLFEKLPEQQRNVVKLKYEGKSYTEIAEILDISAKTVNNHIVKAYHSIRENLSKFISLLIFLFF